MSVQDLRDNPRVNLKVEIGINTETNFYTGFAMNVSTGGLFVATHVPAPVGEQIPLSFILPNADTPIETVAEVRWSREYNPLYPETHPGMGLKFLSLREEDALKINEYIQHVREPYFHPEEDE
ncbi:MAG: TIGR02266 family protein [Myxococcales bacterium]|nr:MAG: TIGR02266 family protein [Myxococcales bacterium]